MHRIPFILIVALLSSTYQGVCLSADKVVVIPLKSTTINSEKLMGQGRENAGLLTHLDQSGYCQTSSRTKFALSTTLTTWEGAAAACPKNTWVCKKDDLPNNGSCSLEPIITHPYIDCNGTVPGMSNHSTLLGWIDSIQQPTLGDIRSSADLSSVSYVIVCRRYRVWCCWR